MRKECVTRRRTQFASIRQAEEHLIYRIRGRNDISSTSGSQTFTFCPLLRYCASFEQCSIKLVAENAAKIAVLITHSGLSNYDS